MADLDKTIQVAINGEDNISKKLRDIDQKLDKFGTSLGGVAGAAGKAATAVAAVSAAITGTFAAGLAAAYQQSADFEQKLLDLKAVIGGEATEAMKDAKTAAMELAQQYGISAGEIMDMMVEWKKAGHDVAGSIEGVTHQLDLMKATSMEANTASENLAKIMQGFGIEAKETQKVVDTLVTTSEEYSLTAGKLSEGLGKVAKLAQQAGFSMEETTGLLTPMIEEFRSGSEAGNAFKRALQKIQDDAGPVQDALETLGVNQKKANGEFRSGEKIYRDVAKAWDTLNDSQKTFVAQQLVGTERAGQFSSAMEGYNKSLEVTKKNQDNVGAAMESASTKMEGANEKANQLATTFETLAISIGDEFRDSAKEGVGGLQELIEKLYDSVEAGTMEEFFKEIRNMSSELADYLDEVADVLPEAMEGVEWSGLANSVREVGDSFRWWFDGLDLTTARGLTQAIQKMVDTLSGSISTFATFNKAAETTWDALRALYNLGQSFTDFIVTTWVSSLELLTEALALVDPTGMFDDANEKLEELKAGWGKELQKEVDQTKKSFKDMTQTISKTPDQKQIKVSETGSENVQKAMSSFRDYEDVNVDVDDEGTAEKTGKEIDKQVPKKKKMEIDAELQKKQIEKEIAKIEAEAEKVEAALDMTAELKTADAEKAMQSMKSAADVVKKGISSTTTAMGDLLDSYTETKDPMKESSTKNWMNDVQDRRDKQFQMQREFFNKMMEEPDEKLMDFDKSDIDKIEKAVSKVTDAKDVKVNVDDKGTAKKTKEEIDKNVPDKKETKVQTDLEEKKVEKDIATIEAKSEKAQAALELVAEVKTAQAEASMEKFKSAMEGTQTAIKATTSSMSDLLGAYTSVKDPFKEMHIENIMDEEQKRREESFKMQKKLTQAELELIRQKQEKLKGEDGLITIQGDGLEPELEAFMWKILERVQVRANEEMSEFLLGLNG